MSPPDRPVICSVDAATATITLNRPAAMNSLDLPTKQALLETLQRVAEDQAVRCVVITGTGRAFCVGQDLREHAESLRERPPEEVWSTVDAHFSPIARTIATMPKPVLAAVNGVAAGAGMSIALACDLRIAAATAGFNTAFTAIGLSCDTGCSWTLQRIVGRAKATDLLLFPRTVDAAEAQRLGLVSEVVPPDQLTATVEEFATKLAQGPTLAYAAVKESLAYAATHSLPESLTFEAAMMGRTGGSSDHRAAVQAFTAKQQPSFEGS